MRRIFYAPLAALLLAGKHNQELLARYVEVEKRIRASVQEGSVISRNRRCDRCGRTGLCDIGLANVAWLHWVPSAPNTHVTTLLPARLSRILRLMEPLRFDQEGCLPISPSFNHNRREVSGIDDTPLGIR